MNELVLISFISPWYAQPIADLFTKVLDYDSTSDEIQVNPYEAAYSCSIILLLVTMLEGMAVRAASMKKELESNERFKALGYIEKECEGVFSKEELKEIFVVRDSIAHSHLWETKVSTDPKTWMDLLNRTLSDSFGDSKHKNVIDEVTCHTKGLQIELIPTKMRKRDALKVFEVVTDSIRCIDSRTNRIMGIDSCRISFNNYELSLLSLYEEVKRIAQHQPSADR